RLRSERGPSATPGTSAATAVRLIVWCRHCGHQVEPDPAEQAERYRAEVPVPEWRERLVCSRCRSRQIDMVVTGTKRRRPKSRTSSKASISPPTRGMRVKGVRVATWSSEHGWSG